MPEVSSHATGAPCWVDLSTPELASSRAFYGALLGWSFATQGDAGGDHLMCLLDGVPVAGMGEVTESDAPPAWTVYLCAPDLDAVVAQAQQAGGQPVSPMVDLAPFGRMMVLTDPTGAVFGLWEPGTHHGAARVSEPGAPAWHEVNTRDAEAARDFYAGLFGLSTEKMPGMTYFTLHPPASEGAAAPASSGVLQMDAAWDGMSPHWMVYFAVQSADESGAKVAELGGEVRYGPFDSPYGRLAVCTDPQGVAFTLIQLADQG
jgi:predicted enzyme related to lactoylglutathione lyase